MTRDHWPNFSPEEGGFSEVVFSDYDRFRKRAVCSAPEVPSPPRIGSVNARAPAVRERRLVPPLFYEKKNESVKISGFKRFEYVKTLFWGAAERSAAVSEEDLPTQTGMEQKVPVMGVCSALRANGNREGEDSRKRVKWFMHAFGGDNFLGDTGCFFQRQHQRKLPQPLNTRREKKSFLEKWNCKKCFRFRNTQLSNNNLTFVQQLQ